MADTAFAAFTSSAFAEEASTVVAVWAGALPPMTDVVWETLPPTGSDGAFHEVAFNPFALQLSCKTRPAPGASGTLVPPGGWVARGTKALKFKPACILYQPP
jgi:hypothetical protein